MPNHPTSPPNTPKTHAKARQGGGVLGQEQGRGGGGVVQAAPAATTLPFTGSEVPLLMLMGAAFLGLGLVLHRMSANRA
jgi:LPXTG-motif cell wall-anchored protein